MGILSVGIFKNLDKSGSEGITLKILTDLALSEPNFKWLILIFICSMVAAVMSTVDSALLSISSIWTKDFYARIKSNKLDHSEIKLLKISKLSSFLVMFVAVVLAILLPSTIWRLIEIKLEILMQVAPAFFLGIHMLKLKESGVFWGMFLGCLTAVVIELGSFETYHIHAGLWGLLVNLLVLGLLQKTKTPVFLRVLEK